MNGLLLELIVALIVTGGAMMGIHKHRYNQEMEAKRQAQLEEDREKQAKMRAYYEEQRIKLEAKQAIERKEKERLEAKHLEEQKIEELKKQELRDLKDPNIQFYLEISDDYRNTSQLTTLSNDPDERYEYEVFLALKNSGYFGEGARFISNAIVPTNTGSFAEIDLMVISKYGIYVIECKNYSKDMVFDNINADIIEYPAGTDKTVKNPRRQQAFHANKLFEYLEKNDNIYSTKIDPLFMSYMKKLQCFIVFPKKTKWSWKRRYNELGSKYFTNDIINIDTLDGMTPNIPEIWTGDQVDSLFEALAPIYQYSQQERDKMIFKRKAEAGGYNTYYKYYVVKEDGYEDPYQIARTDGNSYEVCTDMETEYFTYEKKSADSVKTGCPSKNYVSGPFNNFRDAKKKCVPKNRKIRVLENEDHDQLEMNA